LAPWVNYRSIREDADSAEPDIERYTKTIPNFGLAWDALVWLLARKCDDIAITSKQIDGVSYHLYVQASDDLAGTPQVVVLYTYDDNYVDVLGVLAEPVKTKAVKGAKK